MKVYFVSPIGFETPDLFSTFGLEAVWGIHQADVIFFDLHTRIGSYNDYDLIYINMTDVPVVYFDEWDYGAMSKEVWPHGYDIKENSIYFVRKMDKTLSYPKCVYPYEKIIMNKFPLVNEDELFNREFDICFIGNESPSRKNVVKELQKHFKMYVHWTNENGKIPHEEWLNLHRQAKMFLSADGGGFSDERPYQLFTVAGMLKQKNNHLQAHPFNIPYCVEVSEFPDDAEITTLRLILNDKSSLHSVYTHGASRMKKYYTAEARSRYILDVLKQNNIYNE